MTTIPKAVFKIEHNHKNVMKYINPYVLSVTFTDNEHGQSDEIDIQLEDSQHKWISSWYPVKGDLFSLKIGYEQEALTSCGSFEIDELEFAGAPDTLNIKGLAANIKKALRQNNSAPYENLSLREIAEKIAKNMVIPL